MPGPLSDAPQLVDELSLSHAPPKIHNWEEKVLDRAVWVCRPKIIRLCSECEEIISNKLMMATRDEEDQWRLKEVNLLKDKGECTFELEWENS